MTRILRTALRLAVVSGLLAASAFSAACNNPNSTGPNSGATTSPTTAPTTAPSMAP